MIAELIIVSIILVVILILIIHKLKPTVNTYSCDINTGTCAKSKNGKYKTMSSCTSNCKKSPSIGTSVNTYSCDINTGTCQKDPNGRLSQNECIQKCLKTPSVPTDGPSCADFCTGIKDCDKINYIKRGEFCKIPIANKQYCNNISNKLGADGHKYLELSGYCTKSDTNKCDHAVCECEWLGSDGCWTKSN